MGKPMYTNNYQVELSSYRITIDNFDAALIHILAERLRCTHKVGELKAARKLSETDTSRGAQQLNRLKKIVQDGGLDENFVEGFMHYIIDEVVRRHAELKASLHPHRNT